MKTGYFLFFQPRSKTGARRKLVGANALLSIIFNAGLRPGHGKSRYMANGVHKS